MRSTLLTLLCGAALLLAESAAGLSWTTPAGWISKGAAPMRAANYVVGDAECVVYFFGSGQGGRVEANLARWKGQFTLNGQPAPARTSTRKVNGLSVTEMDVTGVYAVPGGAMSGGNAMSAQSSKAGTRMLTAIIEGPGGNLFVKFTGPEKTVTGNLAKFESLVGSFHKD